MLKLKIGDDIYSFENAEDLLIKDYENLAATLNDKKINEIDRFYKAFVLLGVNGDVLDGLDGFSFLKVIKEFRSVQLPIGEFTQKIILNNREYTSYKDEFFFSVKDMRKIEECVKKNPVNFIAEIMAIIFKDPELTKAEHYDDAHIKYKAKLFRENIQYKVALPFIANFSTQLLDSLNSYKNE